MPDQANEVFRHTCHFARGVVFPGSFRQYFGEFQFSLPYIWFWKQNGVDANFASFERRGINYRELIKLAQICPFVSNADGKHSEAYV